MKMRNSEPVQFFAEKKNVCTSAIGTYSFNLPFFNIRESRFKPFVNIYNLAWKFMYLVDNHVSTTGDVREIVDI